MKLKIYLVFVLFLIAGGVCLFQLYKVQIQRGDYFQALALGQQASFDKMRVMRAEIFFTGQAGAVAQNQKKYLAYIFPEKVENRNQVEELLGPISKAEKALQKEISEEQFQTLRQQKIAGVYTDEILSRIYPYGKLAAHVVGFLNRESKGQYGVEGYYDSILTGRKTGKLADLYLTIDYNIQYFAEKFLKQAEKDWEITAGQIVVSEPQTGKILALAQVPILTLISMEQLRIWGYF